MKRLSYFLFLYCIISYPFDRSFTELLQHGIQRVTHAVFGKDQEQWKWGRIAWKSDDYMQSLAPSFSNMVFPAYISLSWAKAQSDPTTFNDDYIRDVKEWLAKERSTKNVQAIVCLCTDDVPVWFIEQGGFASEQGQDHFIRYAACMIEAIAPYDPIIISFSSPALYAMRAYFFGQQPPYEKSMDLTGHVVLNILNAHARCYHYSKEKWPTLTFGIGHAYAALHPAYHVNPVERATVALFDRLLNRTMLEYFAHGTFTWSVPLHTYVHHMAAERPLDCMLIDYQGGYQVALTRTGFTVSDSLFYPEGLYQAIEVSMMLDVPVFAKATVYDPYDRYNVEAGNKHLIAVHKALQRGFNIAGYSYNHDDRAWYQPNATSSEALSDENPVVAR